MEKSLSSIWSLLKNNFALFSFYSIQAVLFCVVFFFLIDLGLSVLLESMSFSFAVFHLMIPCEFLRSQAAPKCVS